MLDRNTFLRPTAHRGLHDAAKGIIENTAAAFEAAIAKGYGIECDVRPAAWALSPATRPRR
jgi:glycerophosphoryl diester phosphodiesterase